MRTRFEAKPKIKSTIKFVLGGTMPITGHEIKPLYYAVVEASSDYQRNTGRLNGLLESYNSLVEMGYTSHDGENYFEGLSKIDLFPKYEAQNQDLSTYYAAVYSKFAKLELNLSILYGRIYPQSIDRPLKKEGISIQQEQRVSQKQELTVKMITSFSQVSELIVDMNLPVDAKAEALSNIKELESEFKKEKPSSPILRRLVSWAADFSTLTGTPLLPFVIKLLLDNWDKIL